MLAAALGAVAPSGWTPTHVWTNSGLLAPLQEMLFDPSANFPYPMPPDSGQWIANAEVAFAETDRHAGMNVAMVGADVVAELIGYVVPQPDWCSGTCPSSSTTDGPLRLELVLAHLDWPATEPIDGTAILSLDGPATTTISGSAGGVIAFSYTEVGGSRMVTPVWDAACAPYPLDPATPISTKLSKSGAVADSDPNADFLRSFLAGPDVRLPAGSWDISALAIFHDGARCDGTAHSLQTTVRVTVRG